MTDEPLVQRLREAEADMGGTLSVVAERLGGGDPVRYRADASAPAASTIKVFLLIALLERVAAGEARLDDERIVRASDQVAGAGVLKALQPERPYTLRDLAMLMIIVSDNTATNMIIDVVGLPAVEELCARRGWTDTVLTGKLQMEENRPRSRTSATDLADAFARLWRGELLPEREAVFARGVFERQQLTDALGREIGYDGYATETGEDDLVIASKNGSVRGVRHDAGVIRRGDDGFVAAVLTQDCPDPRFYAGNPGLTCIAEVSKLLYDRYLGGPRPARP